MYTHGSCYQFHLILKCLFPDALPYYNLDHIITRIGDKYYDITGEVSADGYVLIGDVERLRRVKFKVHIVDTKVLKSAIKQSKKNL